MTEQAKLLYQFMNQFTGGAWVSGEVPLKTDGEPNVPYPYIVYDLVQPEYGETTLMPVILYAKPAGGNISSLNALVDEINKAVPPKQVTILESENEKGALLLRRNISWAQKYNTEDRNVKAMYFALEITSLIKGD